MELIKRNFLVGIAVCLLSYVIPCHAQSPNETLQAEDVRQENRIKTTAISVQAYSAEKRKYAITTEKEP